MQCDLKNRTTLIEGYLAGTLTEAERESFDEHLFNCPVCFQEVRLREEMAGLIKEEGKTLFADYLARRSASQPGIITTIAENLRRFVLGEIENRWIYATAVGVALVILIFLVQRNWISPTGEPEESAPEYVIQQPDTTQIERVAEATDSAESADSVAASASTQVAEAPPVVAPPVEPRLQKETEMKVPEIIEIDPRELYAANFESSPYLDEMLTDISRAPSVTVLSPKNDANFTADIRFQWEPLEAEALYLKILNNRGEALFDFTPTDNQFVLTEDLAPGLYYWKLETEEELIYLGRFFVNKPE